MLNRAASAVVLKDVAEHAGVSVKTVSNVVRGTVRVSPPTREKVERSLAELGYRPNLSARNLRRGRTGIVALALPALDAPYFSALARATISAAAQRGWTVLIDQTDGRRDRESAALDGVGSHLVDGVLLSPLALDAHDIAGRRSRLPLVLLGERVSDGPQDHVAIDNVLAAREATEHLLGLGRRRVAAVGVQRTIRGATGRLRLQGWREAHQAAGRRPPAALVVEVDHFDRPSGAAAVDRLLTSGARPDALFCFNDLLALGALRTLALHGLRVPEDVAVVGFDDVEDGEYSVPSLTTVRPDLARLADEAVSLLARRIDGDGAVDDDAAHEVRVGHRLVVRESTAGRSA